MDLTKIFSGMDKGPEAIQSNFEKINGAVGDKVSSVTVPITAINGCSVDGSTVVYQIGSHRLAITTGSVSIGSSLSASNKTIDFGRLASDTDIGQGVAWSQVTNWAVGGVITRSGTTLTLTEENYGGEVSQGTYFNFMLVRSY